MDRPGLQEDSFPGTRVNTRDGAHVQPAHFLGNVIFYALLILIALVAVPYGTVEPWWQALFESAVFLLATLWFIEGLLSGSYHFSDYRILLPLIALALFGLLQTVPFGGESTAPLKSGVRVWYALSANPHGTRRWVSEVLALVLVGAMLLRYTVSTRRLRMLVYLVVGVALASAVFGLLRQMTQHQPGFVLPNLRPGLGYAQFINKNHFAFLIEMALGLVLGWVVCGDRARDRLIMSLAVLLFLGGVLALANSRGGILSFFGELVFGALLFTSQSSVSGSERAFDHLPSWLQKLSGSFATRAVLIVVFLITVTIGVIWVGGAPLVGTLEALPTEVGVQTESTRWAVRRWDIWPATWRLIRDHPVTGVGFGGYWMAITRYHNASGEMTPQEAHNDYLEFIASGGLIGLSLGAWFVYVFIRVARKRLRTSDPFSRAARCGAIIGLSGVGIHSSVDFGLHIPVNAALFIVLIVISTVELPQQRESELIHARRKSNH